MINLVSLLDDFLFLDAPSNTVRNQRTNIVDDVPNIYLQSKNSSAYRMSPKISIQDDKYLVEIDVPGVFQDDLNVEIKDSILCINTRSAKDSDEEKADKRMYSFRFSLPNDVNTDTVEAQLKNGVLSISVLKLEEKKPKQIAINAG